MFLCIVYNIYDMIETVAPDLKRYKTLNVEDMKMEEMNGLCPRQRRGALLKK